MRKMRIIAWDSLAATYRGLTAVLQQYEVWSASFAALCESRRLVLVEMREQGSRHAAA